MATGLKYQPDSENHYQVEDMEDEFSSSLVPDEEYIPNAEVDLETEEISKTENSEGAFGEGKLQTLSVGNVSKLPVNNKQQNSSRKSSAWSRLSFAEGARDIDSVVSDQLRTFEVYPTGKRPGFTNFTKTSHYTILTFLPLGLFEQFHQVSNLYFLLNCIIAFIPDVSPITPVSALIPLLFVLTVALFKIGYEDWKRHQADARDNAAPVTILEGGEWVTIKSQDVQVGDIMKVQRGDALKADVIVMSSDDPDGVAFIETAQLDGETNVKPKKSCTETSHITEKSQFLLPEEEMRLSIDPPNDKLYRWEGVLYYHGEACPLNLKNAIWRGSSIRKTEWAFVCAVYVGHETKQGMNLKKRTTRKMSLMLVKLNIVLALIFLFKNVLIVFLAGLSVDWADRNESHWYVRHFIDLYSKAYLMGMNYMTYFILFSFMIPISLFVTVEMCKACQIILMSFDQEMMHWVPEKSEWVPCRPKTSDLNDQLALVKYIFTDKTGTLTENIMKYVEGVTASTTLLPSGDRKWMPHQSDNINLVGESCDITASRAFDGGFQSNRFGEASDTARFLAAISLCHTVVPFENKKTGEFTFEGSSPDEVALVKCARDNSFVLTKRTAKVATIRVNDTDYTYDVVEELEFTATRKMMSIVLKDRYDELFIISKGADSSITVRLQPGNLSQTDKETIDSHLIKSAQAGLRTLCLAWKQIPMSTYDSWRREYLLYIQSVEKSDEKYDALCDKLENDLNIIGLAAYEDKLQDGVPDTIRFFMKSNIVVWMLTGDKLETGIEIGNNCGLADGCKVFSINLVKEQTREYHADTSFEERRKNCIQFVKRKMEEAIKEAKQEPIVLAIDGLALDHSMTVEELTPIFVELSSLIKSAMCCRLTPAQKGQIVDLFKRKSNETTLAIGDGANDATMITASDVGIGIIGLEGSQAELASDYAISRFRHLKRLVAVHGRYSLYRNSMCIGFSFYKNMFLVVPQIPFAFSCAFSGMSLYDGWLLTIKNTAFTFLPPFFMGCFDKDIPEEVLEDPISGPQLLSELGKKGSYRVGVKMMFPWYLAAFVHGVMVYVIALGYLEYEDTDVSGGKVSGLYTTGTSIFSCVVVTVCAKALIHIKQLSIIQFSGVLISILLVPITLLSLSAFEMFFGYSHMYLVAFYLMEDPKFYLFLIITSVGVLSVCDLNVLYIQKHKVCVDFFLKKTEMLIFY